MSSAWTGEERGPARDIGDVAVYSGVMANTNDPFPIAAMLRAAVEIQTQRTGKSKTQIAQDAGIDPAVLSRATNLDERETAPSTARAILDACGMRFVLAVDVKV